MKKRSTWIIALALIIALLAMGCKPEDERGNAQTDDPSIAMPDVIVNMPNDTKDIVSVSGSGKVTLEPDTVKTTFSIESRDETAAETQTKNAEAVQAVMDSLLANGIKESDIQTGDVNIYEDFNYETSPAKVVGYVMRTSLQITVRDIDTIGKVIGDAIAAGVTQTYGLTYSVSDNASAYSDALKAAIEDARVKAGAIADALGLKVLGIPISVTETSSSYEAYEYRDMDIAEDEMTAASTGDGGVVAPISKGEIVVSASVKVEYELLPSDGAAE